MLGFRKTDDFGVQTRCCHRCVSSRLQRMSSLAIHRIAPGHFAPGPKNSQEFSRIFSETKLCWTIRSNTQSSEVGQGRPPSTRYCRTPGSSIKLHRAWLWVCGSKAKLHHCSLFLWNWNSRGQCIPLVIAIRHLRSETPKSYQILSYPIQLLTTPEPQPLLPRKTSAVLGSLAFSGCRCPAPVGSQASQLLRCRSQHLYPWGPRVIFGLFILCCERTSLVVAAEIRDKTPGSGRTP